MSDRQHTPLPWRQGLALIYGPQNQDVCVTYNGKEYETGKANGEFITRACNAHYELVAALKAAQGNGINDDPIVWAQISSAIIKAEKGGA